MLNTDQIVQFIDSVPIPALVLDHNFTINHVNASGLIFFSKEIAPLINQPITKIFPFIDCKVLQQKLELEGIQYTNGTEKFNLTLKLHQPYDASNLNILYIQVTTTFSVDSKSPRRIFSRADLRYNIRTWLQVCK